MLDSGMEKRLAIKVSFLFLPEDYRSKEWSKGFMVLTGTDGHRQFRF